MDRDEAKNILQLCRPGNESDLSDPLIAEAFEVLESDSELQIWFEEQQEFDTLIANQLEAIEPPADLKASILAGMRAHQANAQAPTIDFAAEAAHPEAAQPSEAQPHAQQPTIERNNRAWWLNPWVGIAALFVFMLIITVAPRNGEVQLAQNDPALSGFPPVLPFLSDKIDAMSILSFDKRDKQASQLQTFLASAGSPSPKLCDKLANTPTIGCLTFDFDGDKLSMICFKNGEVMHLITADAAAFEGKLSSEPQVYEFKDKAFKVWVEGDQLNILGVHGTKSDIPEFI